MSIVIDRRLNPSGKSLQNRKKFLERARDQIKDSVKRAVSSKDLKDISKSSDKINIRSKDVTEPTFSNDHRTGSKKRVLPGNKKYYSGDTIDKEKSSKGSGREGGKGEGLDEFEFTLTREEFLEYLFEDLCLPDFIKESLKNTKSVKPKRVGLTNSGSPANLNLIRTFKNSIGRRLALKRPTDEDILELEEDIAQAEKEGNLGLAISLLEKLENLKGRRKVVPYIEEHDLRYNLWQNVPNPQSQAVMFCLMDVSGSMGEHEKDISKRFFLILYLFLERKYDKIDIRFIRHTEVAEEVDEETFFYDKKTGGTLISSGLNVISDIIDNEYPVNDWNIYIAQCTDGDNTQLDNVECESIIKEKLQPIVQYYAYIQISELDRDNFPWAFYSAWPLYNKLSKEFKNIVAKKIDHVDRVWTIFRELFKGE